MRTDGPWIANDKHSNPSAAWRIETDAPGYPNDGYIIGVLDGPDAEDNAKLISAAPDMLHALELVCEFAFMRKFPKDDFVYKQVSEAMHKATGEWPRF